MKENFLGTPLIASKHGAGLDELTWYIHALMALLFIGWGIYFLYVLFRFRKTVNPKADHVGVRNHFSTWVEVGVAVTEGALLLGFAVPLWASTVSEFPAEKESVVVRVTGKQFNWMTRYPGTNAIFGKQDVRFVTSENQLGLDPNDPNGKDDILTQNSEVVVPVNTNVIVHISSMDVIHSFKVFPMRVNQDAIPGMSVPIHFQPTKLGRYPINCAQLCGIGHAAMKGELRVVSQEEWATWLASKSGSGGGGGANEFE